MLLNSFKYLVFAALVALAQITVAQQRPVADTNHIDARGLRQGPWKRINPEGMSYTGQFKDDRPYGQFRHFDRWDRTITILDYFRDGYAAQATHFHPNGNIRATGFYLDQERDSAWEIFDMQGRLLKRENYSQGMLHGLEELFDSQGDLVESTEWYRNLRNGRWWRKNDRGTQWTTYQLNMAHGVFEAHYPDETLRIRGFYEEGQREGIWYFYHDNGLLDRLMHFERSFLVKRQVAINVSGEDILISSDSVAYIHTNGRITEIKMLDGTTHRPSQTFDQLVISFDTEEFFLATPRFFASLRMFDSMVMLPDAEEDHLDLLLDEEEDRLKRRQRALLILKIPTPYEVIMDGEAIGKLQILTNFDPIIEEE